MIGETLKSGIAALGASSASARADALLLLSHVARRSRESLVAYPEAALTTRESREFAAFCARRRSGVPIAYLVGSSGFYGREFLVDESVLVPRPETEHLVEEALRFIKEPEAMKILDVGTGCGAIACTIAAETGASLDATDISSEALEIARENARRLGASDRIAFHHGDLAEPVCNRRYDVIVANLPYIPTADLPKAPDPASFEPTIALDGGPDGLSLYRRLLPQIKLMLKEKSLVLLETAPPTIEKLKELVRSTLPNFAISVGCDYAGLARYIKAATEG
jgi:release factor glutamine methyltransferase